jgi:non-ribosomal peptide synthetase component E (peptide arylation enzyme)
VLVVVEDGSGELGLGEITAHLARTGLSKAKWPEFAFTVGELPQTTVGKLDRSGARRLAHDLHARLAAHPEQHRQHLEQHRQGDA